MIGPDGLSDFWRFLNLPQSLDQQAPIISVAVEGLYIEMLIFTSIVSVAVRGE